MHLLCKLIGAALLLTTGAVLGWRKGDQFVIRATLLYDMVIFLRAVQNNIRYRRDTKANILMAAAEECRMQRLRFTLHCAAPQELPQALQEALERVRLETSAYILTQELQQFARALLTLGDTGAQEETQKLSFTITTLQNAADEADRQAKTQRKLYRTIGLSGGAAAALLFL